MQRQSAETRRLPRTRDVLIRVAPLALLLIGAALAGYKLGWFDYRHALEHVERLRRSHSFAGFTVVFILIVGLGTAAGIPGMPLMVAAGAFFGTMMGAVVSWTGAMISAAIGYWIARTVGRDVITRWLKRFRRIDAAVADARHFGGVLRLRLIPVLPIGAVNFVSGLARAHFGAYLAATAIGVLPAVTIYNYFADSLLERVGNGRQEAFRSLIISSLLLIGLSLAPKLVARRRRTKEAEAIAIGATDYPVSS
jgi:uncharacterized membrane protein YdjX (TVP38/TMEM64 family)